MYAEIMTCEEFIPVEPWLSFEKRWLEMYKKTLEEKDHGKGHVDSRRHKKARRIKEKFRG